ncbi:Uncharacterised protein [Chlamydia abortus]|nr:Uncharacterised protein [Chlamydia abortus]
MIITKLSAGGLLTERLPAVKMNIPFIRKEADEDDRSTRSFDNRI